MVRFRFARLLWVTLFVCGFMVFGSNQAEAEEALASWYGPGFDGLPTASGEMFDADGLSTAHQTLPTGTDLIVGYKGKTVPVTVNDRGPYLGERELDLSQGAARELGLIQPGVDWVQVECADGGISPDCSVAGQPTPPVAPAIQDASTAPITPPVAPAIQDAPTAPITPTAPGAPVVQDETSAAPGAPIVQDEIAAIQDASTAPITPPVAPAIQDETPAAIQDASTPASTPAAPGVPIVQDETSSGVHTVMPGEPLTGIAAGLGTSLEDLMAQNGITNPDLILSGQSLLY